MTKTYRNLISPLFSTSINVDGETFDLRFVIGAKTKPHRENGKFRTSNPKLIKALDESPFYGVKWECVSSTGVEEKADNDNTPEPPDGSSKKEAIGPQEVSAPKTVKEMREYLNKEKGVSWSKLPNKKAAFDVALDLNLKFVNVNK